MITVRLTRKLTITGITINCYELMAGLEGYTPPQPLSPITDRHSFSFYPRTEGWGHGNGLVLGSQSGVDVLNTAVHEFDTEILLNFRKAILVELSPQHPKNQLSGIVKARVTAFQERIDAKRKSISGSGLQQLNKSLPNCDGKVVVYFTSLRGIRKTYEECCLARTILKGYGVRVEERDVSMDRGFRDELKDFMNGNVFLPVVFVNGKSLGEFEDVKRMHEGGELEVVLRDCEEVSRDDEKVQSCERCGNVRFVLCERCSGSCRVYIDDEDEENEFGYRQCCECNENGIVRCHFCCS